MVKISEMIDDSESDSSNDGNNDIPLPLCRYGASCYRKNPEHFRQFRHPNKASNSTNIRVDKNVEVKIEIGHKTLLKSERNAQDNSQEFTVFVRCPGGKAIEYFVEKVIFNLPTSYSHSIVEVTEPPFSLTESSSCSFVMPIDVFFKCSENPKKIRVLYDLNLIDNIAYTNVRLEKITFENPSPTFRELILKAGGLLYQAPDSTTSVKGDDEPGPSVPNKRKRGIFSESLSVANDEFDAFGQLCASKMRKLEAATPLQKIIAERLISEVLYQAQLKSLTNESCVLLAKEKNTAAEDSKQQVIKQETEDSNPQVIKQETEDSNPPITLTIKKEDTGGFKIDIPPIKQEIDTDIEVLPS